MKKILYAIIAATGIFGASSCSDMMQTDSTSFVSDPEINLPSDSVFYTFGIMQAMQQLADQYFLQNELRGDLVTPTVSATTDVRNLAMFNAGAENKYDSVYQYYKVINNCNYYLAKRDTMLEAAGVKIAINEYLSVAAFRAWTYLQLTTQYGNVPYIKTPVLNKSDVNSQTATTEYTQILQDQADYLQTLKDSHDPSQLIAPAYIRNNDKDVDKRLYYEFGGMNYNSSDKHGVVTQMCFMPYNVVLGDLYLELGQYQKAINCYYDYLEYIAINQLKQSDFTDVAYNTLNRTRTEATTFEWPTDFNTNYAHQQYAENSYFTTWDAQFSEDRNRGMLRNGIATYIPMAVNYTNGVTTEVPSIFGYDFYGISKNTYALSNTYFPCPQKPDMMVVPSEAFNDLSQKSPYYYFTNTKDNAELGCDPYTISSIDKGDARAASIREGYQGYENNVYVNKPSTGYFYIYRTTSIYMRIAECFNRMGYPELAFGMLKTGLNKELAEFCPSKRPEPTVNNPGYPEEYYYIPDSYIKQLEDGDGLPPFLSQLNKQYFVSNYIKGIHTHGAGVTAVSGKGSPYSYKPVVEKRIDQIRAKFGVGGGAYTKDEYINAMEDLLCDEYAMEFAFEGRRFSDLLRIARHKNQASPYGAAFGDRWLSDKLAAKKAGITTQNCYLPFK